MTVGQPLIDVRQLLKTYSVEQLNRTADDYFARFDDPVRMGRLLSKPFLTSEMASEVLMAFANLLQGLHLARDQAVLDFGAGPGWASRYLTQMGCRVIACDVSAKALELNRRGFELFPVQGPHHKPRFLPFDGRRLDLPDASVDRVFCQDAFHHVPNQAEVLHELARVVKLGGVAGFSEPGPNHSKSDVSQQEMRDFTVIENDIVLEDIWPVAREAGFSEVRVGYFTPLLTLMTMEEYSAHVYRRARLPRHCAVPVNTMLRERRLFFLYKLPEGARLPGPGAVHRATLSVEPGPGPWQAGVPREVAVRVRNTGNAVWPQTGSIGAYGVGVRTPGGFLRRKRDLGRIPLPPTKTLGCMPGDEVTARGVVPALPKGKHTLLFDLVSEGLFWFADKGSRPVALTVDVD